MQIRREESWGNIETIDLKSYGWDQPISRIRPLILQVIIKLLEGCDEFLSRIAENEAEAVIPPRKNQKEQREYDHHLYKERHLVECFFNKIKHYRRLFSRFEKLDQRHLGFLSFAGALIWLR